MAMMIFRFRFAARPDERAFRAQLRREIGARRSGANNVELSWHADGATAGILDVLSMDGVALVYAAKVCVARGGEHVGGRWQPPAWATRRWLEIPWTTRLRLWIGPTKTYGEA